MDFEMADLMPEISHSLKCSIRNVQSEIFNQKSAFSLD